MVYLGGTYDSLGCKINIETVKATQRKVFSLSESPGFTLISWQLHVITSFPEKSTGSSNQLMAYF